jgi:hypothetical protein
LGGLFRAGDPLVAQDPSDGYYLESATLQGADGHLDQDAAQALVRRVKRNRGIAPGQDNKLERELEEREPRHHADGALASLVPTPGELRVKTKMKTVTAARKETRVTGLRGWALARVR